MFSLTNFKKEIFEIQSHLHFEKLAIEAFEYQYLNNNIYHLYCDLLKTNPSNVKKITQIPFLPVSFFKTHKVVSQQHENFTIFTSSSTSGTVSSKHFVADLEIYRSSFLKTFELFYGLPSNYAIVALLPSYLERDGSSLIYMVEELIQLSDKKQSGFFLNEYDKLFSLLQDFEKSNQKYILIGVSFALLDFAEKYQLNANNGIIMETGGMKGKRKEITRTELHSELKSCFGTTSIHSEYGMTELLSQAYAKENGQYFCPPWMRVLVREATDPLSVNILGSGALNIIDLANINSCCFIETSDLGIISKNGSFTVSGRFDNAEVRGCNLMSGQ